MAAPEAQQQAGADGEVQLLTARSGPPALRQRCMETIAEAFAANEASSPMFCGGPQSVRQQYWLSMQQEVLSIVPEDAVTIFGLPDATAAAVCHYWDPATFTGENTFERTATFVRPEARDVSERLGAFWHRMDEQALAMHGPFWDVAFLGVQPGLARSGLGRRVLQRILQHADEQRRPVFLAASGDANHAWYGRYGKWGGGRAAAPVRPPGEEGAGRGGR